LPLWLGISVYVWFWPTKYLTEDMRLLPASDVTTTTGNTHPGHFAVAEVTAGETTDSLPTSVKEPANVVYEEKRI
jgi:hypothetical protein